MSAKLNRGFVVGVLLVAAFSLLPAGNAWAALDEKPALDDINDTAAVLHGLYKQIVEIEGNLTVIRASFSLTERQYLAQKKLVDTEKAHGNELRSQVYQVRLDQLERQMKRVKEFDFESIYAKRIDEIQKKIDVVKMHLEARIREFEVLFGKTPHVPLDFLKELRARQGTRVDAAHYIKLD